MRCGDVTAQDAELARLILQYSTLFYPLGSIQTITLLYGSPIVSGQYLRTRTLALRPIARRSRVMCRAPPPVCRCQLLPQRKNLTKLHHGRSSSTIARHTRAKVRARQVVKFRLVPTFFCYLPGGAHRSSASTPDVAHNHFKQAKSAQYNLNTLFSLIFDRVTHGLPCQIRVASRLGHRAIRLRTL